MLGSQRTTRELSFLDCKNFKSVPTDHSKHETAFWRDVKQEMKTSWTSQEKRWSVWWGGKGNWKSNGLPSSFLRHKWQSVFPCVDVPSKISCRKRVKWSCLTVLLSLLCMRAQPEFQRSCIPFTDTKADTSTVQIMYSTCHVKQENESFSFEFWLWVCSCICSFKSKGHCSMTSTTQNLIQSQNVNIKNLFQELVKSVHK